MQTFLYSVLMITFGTNSQFFRLGKSCLIFLQKYTLISMYIQTIYSNNFHKILKIKVLCKNANIFIFSFNDHLWPKQSSMHFDSKSLITKQSFPLSEMLKEIRTRGDRCFYCGIKVSYQERHYL